MQWTWDAQANESNLEKIELWQISHANGNTKISFENAFAAKELTTVILVSDANTAKYIYKLQKYVAQYNNEHKKEKSTTVL